MPRLAAQLVPSRRARRAPPPRAAIRRAPAVLAAALTAFASALAAALGTSLARALLRAAGELVAQAGWR